MYTQKIYPVNNVIFTSDDYQNIYYSTRDKSFVNASSNEIIIIGDLELSSDRYFGGKQRLTDAEIRIVSTKDKYMPIFSIQNSYINFFQYLKPSTQNKTVVHNALYPLQNLTQTPLNKVGSFDGLYPTDENPKYNICLTYGTCTCNLYLYAISDFYIENTSPDINSKIQVPFQTIDNIASTYDMLFLRHIDDLQLEENTLENVKIKNGFHSITDISGNINTKTVMTSNYIDLSNINIFEYHISIEKLDDIQNLIDNEDLIILSCATKKISESTIMPQYLNVSWTKPDDQDTQLVESDNPISFTAHVNDRLLNYKDLDDRKIFSESTMTEPLIDDDKNGATQRLTLNIKKILDSTDFKVEFRDISNTWHNYLGIESSYNLKDVSYATVSTSGVIDTPMPLKSSSITFSSKAGIKPLDNSYNDMTIQILEGSYTRKQLYNLINTNVSTNKYLNRSKIILNNNNNTQFEININRAYTADDYNMVFYDIYSFVKCTNRITNLQNVSWNDTLGWFLGFRKQLVYSLDEQTGYSISAPYAVGRRMNADTTFTNNIYNYFLLKLDDYTQSHLNDGLITIGNDYTNVYDSTYKMVVNNQVNDLPNYITNQYAVCNPATKKVQINNIYIKGENKLTNNQVYAAQQILDAKQLQQTNTVSYSKGPYIQDLFALIPIKTTGATSGATITDSSGPLQNQNRVYFGPVNIRRMTVSLLNDKGDLVDLNGSNWSFSLVCEQLYQKNVVK